jgi:hypothetical protein
VVVGEETAVLIEDGELGEEDAERVLYGTGVLDLQNFGEIRGADFLVGAANAMLDDWICQSDYVWLESFGGNLRRDPLMSRPILKNCNSWINKVRNVS